MKVVALHTIIWLIIALFGQLAAQINTPKKPKPKEFTPVNDTRPYSNTQSSQNTGNSNDAETNSNASTIHHSTQSANAIFNRLNQNNISLNRTSFIPPKQIGAINYVKSLVNEINAVENTISYQLPILQTDGANSYFENAYNEIVDMLEGRQSLSLKRAVFLTENAWFGGGLNYDDYNQLLKEAVYLIKAKIKQEGMSVDNNLAINYMTHQYISDTLKIELKGQNKTKKITTYPKTYDFNDPFGYHDVRKMFVSKLMTENAGQCKSMPLYYLMLVEALGGNAYLSFSPSHTYIQCKDRSGELYNVELTNGMLTSDSWIVGSGYVKSEAVKSGIYLDTLNKKQVIANCLIDLSLYYKWRFSKNDMQQGYDHFNLKCINQALEYHPVNINALLEKSNYYSVLLNYIAAQLDYTTEEDFEKNEKVLKVFIQRNKLYALTDGLGYEPMPEEEYLNWLRTFDKKEHQQENEKQYSRFQKNTPNHR